MARTVLSVALKQTPGRSSKTSSTKGNVVASIASSARTASASSRSLPPKKSARIAKKVQENVHEKKSLNNTSDDNQIKERKPKKAVGEGLKGKYVNMIAQCIFTLKQKHGSSRSAIGNQLKLQFAGTIGYNETEINHNVKLALKKGLDDGVFKMAKEVGRGSGSYKLTDNEIKKMKKKLTVRKQPVKAKMKQQQNLESFISRTPKSHSPLTPVNTNSTWEPVVLLENVLSPKFDMEKSGSKSLVKTSKYDSVNDKSSLQTLQAQAEGEENHSGKIVKTPNYHKSSVKQSIKTPESYVLLENVMASLKRKSSLKKGMGEPFTTSSSSPVLRKKVREGK